MFTDLLEFPQAIEELTDTDNCVPDEIYPTAVHGLPHEITLELFELSSAIDLIGRAAAARLGINQTDLICLDLLVRRGPMGAGDVAAALGLTTAAISAMATRLEAGGYAHREMDPNDRRRVLLRASPAGARQAFSLFDSLYQAAAELHARHSDRDQKKLLALLRQYRELIAEHAETVRAQTSR
jgi:DNA-binding MarR family transcriptional regulator